MRELKKQSIPITIDRNTAPDTSVGLWITPGVHERLKATQERKVRCCRARAHTRPSTQAHSRARTPESEPICWLTLLMRRLLLRERTPRRPR
eukprot:5271099-Prymnesium_polylepis.1